MLRRSRRKIALILLAATALNVAAGTSEFEFNPTHEKPTAKWTKSLPLDNEHIGATVFAGPEVAALSQRSTLRVGGRHDYTFLNRYKTRVRFRDSPFGKKRLAVSLDATVSLASNWIHLRPDPTDGADFAILRNISSVAVGHDSNRCHYNWTVLPVPAAS
jgi:hypothetical protein